MKSEHERRLENAARAYGNRPGGMTVEAVVQRVIDAYNAPLTRLVPDEVYEKAIEAFENTDDRAGFSRGRPVRAAVDVAIREHPIIKAAAEYVAGIDRAGSWKRLNDAVRGAGL